MDDESRRQLMRDLRDLERHLSAPSLAESLRLLESPRFAAVTEAHVRAVGEYRPIEVAGERYFEKARSRSREASAMLGFARMIGPGAVREDLRRLRTVTEGSNAGSDIGPRDPL